MNKIKFLKKYTYATISNFDFNVLIHFDYDCDMLLYSLEVEDSDYHDNINYLIEYASWKDEDEINEAIKKFMLAHVWCEIDKWITMNDCNDWKVEVVEDALKLINKTTKQWTTWNIFDYDEDYEAIQNKIIKFLGLNNQHNN